MASRRQCAILLLVLFVNSSLPDLSSSSFAPPATEPSSMLRKFQQSWRQHASPRQQQALGKTIISSIKVTTRESHDQSELVTPGPIEQTIKSRATDAETRTMNHYRPSAPLMLNPSGGNPVNQVRSSRPASSATAIQAAAAASTVSVAQLNSNATSATSSTTPKRIVKQRRIKTLLPVGLSSWLLGGIRDLDARHWKLPNEIMSKLAINDVDLQHYDQANHRTAKPADESTSVINISNQVQSGGSLERADQPRPGATRTPSNQMSPR